MSLPLFSSICARHTEREETDPPVCPPCTPSAILLCYFLIPRTPTITFDSPKVPSPAFFANDSAPYISSADPTAFNFQASIAFASTLSFCLPLFFSGGRKPYEPLLSKQYSFALLGKTVDASASYLAVNYHSFDLTVRLQETGGIVAQQSYGSGEISVPARRVTSYEVGPGSANPLIPLLASTPEGHSCSQALSLPSQFPITFAGNYTNANNPTCT